MENATLAGLSIVPVRGEYQIRIPSETFLAFIAIFACFVLVPGLGRIVIRLYVSKRLFLDDYLLLFAILCLAPAAALTSTIYSLIYEQVWTGIGWNEPPPRFYPEMLLFEQRILASSSLVWAALYAIKFAFLVFFHKLVSRIQRLMILWWMVVALTAACALVSIPLGFLICSHLTPDYMSWCPISSQLANEKIYLLITCVMDVVTDILILVIPLLLLWPLQLALRRKLALMGMMSLSTFMIVIAIVRVAGAQLPNGVIDTSWLVFWSAMESAIAVLMVSLLVLKSMFSIESERRSERRRRLLDAEKGLSDDWSASSPVLPSPVRRSWRSSFRYSPIETAGPARVQRQIWNPVQLFSPRQSQYAPTRCTPLVHDSPIPSPQPASIGRCKPPRGLPRTSPPSRSRPAAQIIGPVGSPTFLIDRSSSSSAGVLSASPRLMSMYFHDFSADENWEWPSYS